MKYFILFISLFLLADRSKAQKNNIWHGQQRELHYRPSGTDFIKASGSRKFNRALYGSNTAFRVEAGDLPEFALYLPGMGGNFRMGLVTGNKSKWLTMCKQIKSIYRPGSMIYEIRDSLLGKGSLYVTVLALDTSEGMIVKVESSDVNIVSALVIAYGGATGKKFSRDGDIGADPESSFYLQPEYCKDNNYRIHEHSFMLEYGAGDKMKQLAGVFPLRSSLKVSDAAEQESPLSLLAFSGKATRPLITSTISLGANEVHYFLIHKPGHLNVLYKELAGIFNSAEAARKAMAARVIVNTPDPYINTLGGALSMAADGIWEDPSYLHGAVAWRMRLPAWRGAYVADPLGWHDRTEKHFSSYALSQVITPASGPVVADTALHLARQLEKMGTSMFSSGYISRNPNGDLRPHHYDMNLVFVDQLLNHFNWTGDTAYVKQMWPLLQRHLAWEKRNYDSDNDGLYDAYACIWASDALEYSGGGVTHSSAYNYRSNKTAAMLAKMIGEDGALYEAEAEKIAAAMQDRLWLKDKGWYAEYTDRSVNGQVHPAAGLWTIYHAIDSRLPDMFQRYQCLRYVDMLIPHIPVKAKGLDMDGLQLLSTTNWQPYTWSVNNVALAENLHTALAYWQGGRNEHAYQLWRSALIESMYLSASPGGFEQLSYYDAFRGELYRDFADPVGIAGRTLVEGLFGIMPDALNDTLLIKPGFPEQWKTASLTIPDIDLDFSRTGLSNTYVIRSHFKKKLHIELQLPVIMDGIVSVTVNGKPVDWQITENTGAPLITIHTARMEDARVVIKWKGNKLEPVHYKGSVNAGEPFNITAGKASVIKVYDPQLVLASVSLKAGSLKGVVSSALREYPSFFVLLKQGNVSWWQSVDLSFTQKQPIQDASADAATAVPVVIKDHFNDKVTNVFRQQYVAPRPASSTLQLPVQGIGNWCYPLAMAAIDDSGLRKLAGPANELLLPGGLKFSTPSAPVDNNIAFTSLFDVYPDSITIPLSGNASHAFFLMAGTTNHMQSQLVNGKITVTYTDGTTSVLELKNPESWWPVEQDYYEDGYAFHLNGTPPVRVHLKDGKVFRGFAPAESYTTIKGFSNRVIDGGAATVLELALDPLRSLKSVTVKTIAHEVVIGLMGVSLIRTK